MDLSLAVLGCMIPVWNHLAAAGCTDFVEKTNAEAVTKFSPTHKEIYIISLRANRNLFHPVLCSILKTLCFLFFIK